MEKILALLTEIKGYFTGQHSAEAKLAIAEASIADLTAQLATAHAASADGAVKITHLTAQLETAQSEVNAKGTEITNLQASLVSEKNRANATLAAQGLPLDHIPALSVGENLPGPAAETPWAKWQRLSATDPRAAGYFYASDAQNILNSRPA